MFSDVFFASEPFSSQFLRSFLEVTSLSRTCSLDHLLGRPGRPFRTAESRDEGGVDESSIFGGFELL